jgi:hypothetical protein
MHITEPIRLTKPSKAKTQLVQMLRLIESVASA